MKRSSVAVISFFLATTAALVACSSEAIDPCTVNPKAKACQPSSTTPATTASTYTTASVPTPTVYDAGVIHKPDAGDAGPTVPEANVACQDLLRCCSYVRDTVERGACLAVGYKASANSCANAIIAYQAFGGCSHDSLSIPDIFNSDGSYNSSKDCTYLERACVNDPSQCDAAYQCDGVSVGTKSDNSTSSDPCATATDPYCCRYPNDYECSDNPLGTDNSGSSSSSSSTDTSDPCAGASDHYCCMYPNQPDCQDPSSY